MNNGANEFGVSIITFWITVCLMLFFPDRLGIVVVIGFIVAIACGLLADKYKKLF